jgi:hypothetical protein
MKTLPLVYRVELERILDIARAELEAKQNPGTQGAQDAKDDGDTELLLNVVQPVVDAAFFGEVAEDDVGEDAPLLPTRGLIVEPGLLSTFRVTVLQFLGLGAALIIIIVTLFRFGLIFGESERGFSTVILSVYFIMLLSFISVNVVVRGQDHIFYCFLLFLLCLVPFILLLLLTYYNKKV